ncbi:helix-turn-helix transcriptional regulator [Luteibacter yeojuensis]|uniref:DNA-binding protein n=1 Tax=Luteibacter yeojuensis TaxID=345309 RepID=A0A0F3KBQ0_9GAMM|nr:YafY family protein [Luteibacter yeojuensis]KJV28442.1 DNA-binding protein [Luteibacter yeojuensis]
MRRADRLFQIIQVLRRSSRPMTAAALAEEIETSRRTIYRDITDLIGQRVPITGEAGVGYVLDRSYDMPPLMLTPDEIEAIVLGSQWVAGLGDKTLASAAKDVLGKIAAVIPENLRPHIARPSVGLRPFTPPPRDDIDTNALRQAIRDDRKVRMHYCAESGEESTRIIWPVVLGYDATLRMLIAWCELREGFRHFRTDRIVSIEVLAEGNGLRKGELLRRWTRWREAQPPYAMPK